jgi:pimeloyl-ACP methyl ester carboxylesterase
MPKLNVNGLHLYYEIHGQGYPLVLIAGFTCDIYIWHAILDELSHHFQVIIFDNRGAGESDNPDVSYSIEDMAEDTMGLIQKLGLEKPHILGHSMGGCIAQQIGFKYSQQINKLIISNSLIKFNKVSTLAQELMLKLRQDSASGKRVIEAVVPWLFSNHYLENQLAIQDWIKLLLNPLRLQSVTGTRRQLDALINFDSRKWYKKIQAPTLIIAGEEDILCPHDSQGLAMGIPHAQFVGFAHQAHLPLIETPHEFNRVIINFLKD